MMTNFHPPEWLLRTITGVVSGLSVYLLLFLAKNSLRLMAQTIHLVKERQKMEKSSFLSVYADIEEILGDFSEKYRNIAKTTPSLSRREFFTLLLFDILRLFTGLFKLTIQGLIGSGEVPRA